ncbi:hypothetical protein [Ectobacillus funiculus]|uniref:Uncharacterized protein n=1 Tax=Ectobacillus funiculus TaxID=137993 RepID=A0ABV5WFH8_9BACI
MHNPTLNELMKLIGDLQIEIEYAKACKGEAQKKLLNRLGLDKLEEVHWKTYEEGLESALTTVNNLLKPTEQELQTIENARK